MPVITPQQAPTFETPGATITGLASPSRGATDVAAWRVALEPGHESPKHSLVDREEVFVVLSGAVTARYADREVTILGTHFGAPTAGRIVSDGRAWRYLTEGARS